MKKDFRAVKASLIMGIFIVSIFAIIIPVTPAKEGGLIGFSHVVDVQWSNSENSSIAIVPFEESRPLKLEVDYRLTKGPFGGLIYKFFYTGRLVNIRLDIISYPSDWSTVTMIDNTISFGLPATPSDILPPFKKDVFISVDDKAPAFKEGIIQLKVSVDAVGMISKYEKVIELRFKPDYSPQLNVIAETQNVVIGPMDTKEIPIKVTNLGNGETKVFFKVPNVPTGWMAIITDQITLSPDQTETVYLTVKPPKGFGYHDDAETLIIEYTPAWSENLELQGVTEQVSVAIESRGISIVGIEVILPIIILILLVIFGVYYLIKKMRRK